MADTNSNLNSNSKVDAQKQKISWSPPDFGEDEKEAAIAVINSGWITQGKETEAFERELESYTGAKHAVVVNNGTSALIASLLAHNIGPGDEVIVPSLTFIATVNSVIAVGAKPVLADSDINTWNLTPELAEKKITKKTRAVIPVDAGGMPVDIGGFTALAKKHSLILIEDAAEALGSRYKGESIGSFGHTSIVSFHIAKSVATAEGGAILTNDGEIAAKLRRIRNHGMSAPYNASKNIHYDYVDFGLNFRITDIQSAIGRSQLKKLDTLIQKRKKIVDYYKSELKEYVKFQSIPDYVTLHPYLFFGITAKDEQERNALAKHLLENGVDIRICWLPAHKQPYHSKLFPNENLPNSEALSKTQITLPLGNGLPMEQAEYVAKTVKSFFEKNK